MLNSKVPENEVSAKAQGVSTCALEVSARSRRSLRVWALGSGKSQSATTWSRKPRTVSSFVRAASECEYLVAGVSAKSHSVVPVEEEAGLLAKQSVARLVAKQQVAKLVANQRAKQTGDK